MIEADRRTFLLIHTDPACVLRGMRTAVKNGSAAGGLFSDVVPRLFLLYVAG